MDTLTRVTLSMALCAGLGACAPGAGTETFEVAGQAEGALGEARIVFGADWSETTIGKLRAGDAIEVAYDADRLPDCRGEQAGIAQWSITALYKVGDGEVQSVVVAGLGAAEPATIVADQPGTLEVWFENTNRWGCHAYDSDFGDNYRFPLAAPVGQPGWVGNGAHVVDRWTCDGGPCDASRVGLDSAFVFGTWARQRATVAALYFDVWEESVTDWDNPDLWKQVDAQIHYRFTGQSAFSARYVDFSRRVNHDARYELKLRTIDPFFAMPSVVSPEQCPDAALTLSGDGQYVATEVEYYFSADGVELRPAPGQTFVGRFEDYASPYTACLDE